MTPVQNLDPVKKNYKRLPIMSTSFKFFISYFHVLLSCITLDFNYTLTVIFCCQIIDDNYEIMILKLFYCDRRT